jgi:hypothetical protein
MANNELGRWAGFNDWRKPHESFVKLYNDSPCLWVLYLLWPRRILRQHRQEPNKAATLEHLRLCRLSRALHLKHQNQRLCLLRVVRINLAARLSGAQTLQPQAQQK